jgi:hypothetical protein
MFPSCPVSRWEIGLFIELVDSLTFITATDTAICFLFRCSQYRGSTVEFNTCLNLSNPQFVTSTNPKAPPTVHNNTPFKPRFGQHPAITPAPGQVAASGFRPAPPIKSVTFPFLHFRGYR